jgi:hypothetical protein
VSIPLVIYVVYIVYLGYVHKGSTEKFCFYGRFGMEDFPIGSMH